jgi:hypothetical protein
LIEDGEIGGEVLSRLTISITEIARDARDPTAAKKTKALWLDKPEGAKKALICGST